MMLFSRFKKTELVEKERSQLVADYKVYNEVEGSEKLKTYLSLREKVDSATFKNSRREIESLRWKGSPEQKLEEEFKKLQNNPKIKIYFSVVDSDNLRHFKTIENGKLLIEFIELNQYVKSGQVKSELKAFNQKKKDKSFHGQWEDNEAFKKNKRYNDILMSADFQKYSKFKASKTFKIFTEIENSALLNRYEDLEKELQSSKFKERKAFLEDKNRYEKTDDFSALQKYEKLNNDQEIQLYLKHHGTDAFKFFRNWKKNFSDEFNHALDTSCWKLISPIAEKGPGKAFTPTGLYHYNNGMKNIEVKGGVLTVQTLNEKKKGLYWDPKFGFIEKEFDYTSGFLHSIHCFTQQYGYFDVKLKVSKAKGVNSTVSLCDNEEENCILLFSTLDNKAFGGIVTTDHNRKLVHRINLKYDFNGYIIVGVKWTPDKVEWRVNGRVMGILTQNVPQTKLGLRFESEVVRQTARLPHRLDIDWIRCYSRNL